MISLLLAFHRSCLDHLCQEFLVPDLSADTREGPRVSVPTATRRSAWDPLPRISGRKIFIVVIFRDVEKFTAKLLIWKLIYAGIRGNDHLFVIGCFAGKDLRGQTNCNVTYELTRERKGLLARFVTRDSWEVIILPNTSRLTVRARNRGADQTQIQGWTKNQPLISNRRTLS